MSRHIRVYVAAPFDDGPRLATTVIPEMIYAGLIPLASWIDDAVSGKTDQALTVAAAQAALHVNDFELLSSDAILVIARDGVGGEMFCEVGRAIVQRLPIFWVGRRVLSSWRPGVTVCDSVADAIDAIKAVMG